MCCEDICPTAVPRTVQRRRKHIPLGQSEGGRKEEEEDEEAAGGGKEGEGLMASSCWLSHLALPLVPPPLLFPSSDNHEFRKGTIKVVGHLLSKQKISLTVAVNQEITE